MVKRKLDGAVDRSSEDQKIVNRMQLYSTCERSGGVHLAKPGHTAGWLADEIWARLEILKAFMRYVYKYKRKGQNSSDLDDRCLDLLTLLLADIKYSKALNIRE